ncbi:hypothetical protein ABKN59_001025 [Abortiporus biennis]
MTNIETQKQQYSRELAAYTLRQWDVARQSLQTDNTEPGAKSSHRSSRSNSASRDPTLASQGIQSIDFAKRSHKPSLNIEPRGRQAHSGHA